MLSSRCIMCFSMKHFVYKCICSQNICNLCKLISSLGAICSIDCSQSPILNADDNLVRLRLNYIEYNYISSNTGPTKTT